MNSTLKSAFMSPHCGLTITLSVSLGIFRNGSKNKNPITRKKEPTRPPPKPQHLQVRLPRTAEDKTR